MRTPISVDRPLLEKTVKEVESNGPLRNINALTRQVAETYNLSANTPITPAVVGLRIKEWGLVISTQKGRQPKSPMKHRRIKDDIEDDDVDGENNEDSEGNIRRDQFELGYMIVATPAGTCPVKLKGIDADTVKNWAVDVIEAGRRQMRNFSFAAVKYFVREFYDIHGPEYKIVCNHLNDWLQGN
jgi:hypothetical protein